MQGQGGLPAPARLADVVFAAAACNGALARAHGWYGLRHALQCLQCCHAAGLIFVSQDVPPEEVLAAIGRVEAAHKQQSLVQGWQGVGAGQRWSTQMRR